MSELRLDATAGNPVHVTDSSKLRVTPICNVTGHPCGTDTISIGESCPGFTGECVVRQRDELAEALRLIDDAIITALATGTIMELVEWSKKAHVLLARIDKERK